MIRRHHQRNVYSLLLSVLSLLTLAFSSSTAYATTASSPSGTLVNGWYKDSANISFNWQHTTQQGDYYIGVCAYGVAWNGYSPAGITYNFTQVGQHNYNFLTNTRGDIYVSIDSQSAQPVIAVCQNQTAMYPPDSGSVLWQGNVNLDNTNPSVSITSPTNNSNVSSNSVTVSGITNDTGSGIAKVLVNGQQASIAGSNFSITLPVSQGLNTISATAYDQVGHTSTSNSVVVYSSAPTPNSTGSSANSPSGSSNAAASNKTNSPKSTNGTALGDTTSKSNSSAANSISDRATASTRKYAASKTGIEVGVGIVLLLLASLGLLIKFGWLKVLKQRLKEVKEGIWKRL